MSQPSSTASSPAPMEGEYSFVNVVTDGTWPDSWGKPPKTRKRITKQQLEMLEDLFRSHSHPTREERQMLAAKTGMELRSVTIWLQNKRQLVKKTAKAALDGGSSSTSSSNAGSPEAAPPRTTASPSPSLEDRPRTRPLGRPSLDRVASLSEYPSPARPVTFKNSEDPLWSHMPSSPPQSPPSPIPSKHLGKTRAHPSLPVHKLAGRPYPPLSRTTSVDSAATCVSNSSYHKQRDTERAKLIKPSLTLEWACAQAANRPAGEEQEERRMTGDEVAKKAVSQASQPASVLTEMNNKASADEMQAALALCGLLRG